MSGFFTDIRGYFDAKYSGRYLALLLREVALQAPKTFFKAIGLPREREFQIEREWVFAGANGRRSADLAVLVGGEPRALIEIKEDDGGNIANSAQLSDYLSFTRKNAGMRFVHLSRYPTRAADEASLREAIREEKLNVSSLRYRDILERLSPDDSQISRMVAEYLEDLGVHRYETIDTSSSAVKLFLVDSLGAKHRHRLSRLYSQAAVNDVPIIIKRLLGNMAAIGDWIKGANGGLFRQKFQTRFLPRPEYNLQSLRRLLAKDNEYTGALPGNRGQFLTGGTVYFYAQGALTSAGGYLYLETDIGLKLNLPEHSEVVNSVQIEMYAEISGERLETSFSFKMLNDFPSEMKAQDIFRKLIETARREALRLDTGKRHTKALSALAIP